MEARHEHLTMEWVLRRRSILASQSIS
jgi:hypothetical protein